MRYAIAALVCVVPIVAAVIVNRRIKATMPARPTPLTLAERFDAEMLMGDYDDGPKDAA